MSHPSLTRFFSLWPKKETSNPGDVVNFPLPAVVDYEILFAAQLTLAEHAMAHIGHQVREDICIKSDVAQLGF